MDVEIRNLPTRHIVSKMTMGPYHESAPAAWQGLSKMLGTQNLQAEIKSVIGYGLDNRTCTPAHMLRYVAGFELNDKDYGDRLDAFEQITLETGRYGIYTMKGDYSKMPEKFQKLHKAWLPTSGEVVDFTRPFLEIYLNSPDEVGIDNVLTELCLPLRDPVTMRDPVAKS